MLYLKIYRANTILDLKRLLLIFYENKTQNSDTMN
jgi:hypothetical protein